MGKREHGALSTPHLRSPTPGQCIRRRPTRCTKRSHAAGTSGEGPEDFYVPRVLPQFAFPPRLPLRPSLRIFNLSTFILAMFFHAQLLIAALLAASCVLGVPNTKRQTANPCDGLGAGTYSNITDFRVAALNPTGRNENPYGSELVQGITSVTQGVSSTTFTVSTTHPQLSRCKLPNLPPGTL